ncbi:MAG: hypothetical protein HKN23_03685 [Verrucomicrobiales bacterium]|nr:hypothetical protein [Verrucomicrobiales bacterium]
MHPVAAIVLVSVILAALMVGISWLARRFSWEAELARKAVHVSLGTVTLSFPWLFDELWPVLVLGVLAISGFLILRMKRSLREGVGGALHGVERRTFGEIYFTLAVALVFWLSKGDPILYCIPILILTVADAAGALVGKRYGETGYATLSGRKSAEGSVTIFTATFFSAHIPLLLAAPELSRSGTLLVALTLAVLVMLFEAVATHGLDNLCIPFGGWFALQRFMDKTDGEMAIRLLVLVILLGMVMIVRKRSSLDGSAILGAVLYGFLCWSLGSWLWFLPPLILFASHLIHTPLVQKVDAKLNHDLRSILGLAATTIAWMLIGTVFQRQPDYYVVPFTIVIAGYFAMTSFGTLAVLKPDWPRSLRIILVSLKAVILSFLPLLAFNGWSSAPLIALPAVLFTVWAFSQVDPENPRRRWQQALVVFAISFIGLV